MRRKTEELYRNLLPKRIVTFSEIAQFTSNIIGPSADRKYIYRKYVTRLIETGRLQPIRKGLYAILSPLEKPERHETDKFLIASKIRRDYYLGYHTALEYYGSAYSAFNEAYVCVQPQTRFDSFNYGRFVFTPVFTKDTISQITEKPYGQDFIRVSTKERTFIECLDRVQYAGGWEECIKSLAELGGIDLEKTAILIIQKGKQTLTREAGYFLERLRDMSPFYEHLNDDLLEKLKKQVKGAPQYLIRGEPGKLNKRWRLYIPEGLEEKLKGI
jgi:predicted transcriptional regulator of viral defense system